MKRILAFAIFAVLVVSFVPSPAVAQECPQNCDGLSGLPPQYPASRTWDQFIQLSYWGAYGRAATCNERLYEFGALASAASYGGQAGVAVEAKRFVAVLFETSGSYYGEGYEQTAEYSAHNYDGSVGSFVTDLYRAFLQREPDDAGHCFWVNNTCSVGRKATIAAFIESIEFGRLIDGLTVGSAPSCSGGGDGGDGGDGGGCGNGRFGQFCEQFGTGTRPW